MKTILFLDDWMLDQRINLTRQFIPPLPAPQPLRFADADAPELAGYIDVLRDPQEKVWKLWYCRPTRLKSIFTLHSTQLR